MNKPLRKSHPLISIANNALVDLPAPSNISAWWNFGSLLGLWLKVIGVCSCWVMQKKGEVGMESWFGFLANQLLFVNQIPRF